jgi:hypothetical protein
MTSDGFLSTGSVVVILACIVLLAIASAVTLAPFDRLSRRRVVAFVGSLAGIWALAAVVIWLIRRTI